MGYYPFWVYTNCPQGNTVMGEGSEELVQMLLGKVSQHSAHGCRSLPELPDSSGKLDHSCCEFQPAGEALQPISGSSDHKSCYLC